MSSLQVGSEEEHRREAQARRQGIRDGAEPEHAFVLTEVNGEQQGTQEGLKSIGPSLPHDEEEENGGQGVRGEAEEMIRARRETEERVGQPEDELRNGPVVPGVQDGIEDLENEADSFGSAPVDKDPVISNKAVIQSRSESDEDYAGEAQDPGPVAPLERRPCLQERASRGRPSAGGGCESGPAI